MTRALVRSLVFIAALAAAPAVSAPEEFAFDGIDGETIALAEWAGRPVLVVNTASRCAFTPQYDALQALYDQYRDAGLVVLAVPSNDFRQELATADAIQEFCAVNFDLDLPMTDITRITGRDAHPFYKWLASEHDIHPRWNFHKVLLDRKGRPVAAFGSTVRPLSRPVTRAVEAALAAD
jgi:glutathione peroxidase